MKLFNLFKGKTELEKLQEKYASLHKKAFEVSKTDRKASDAFYKQAEEIAAQIEKLKTKEQ